VEIHGEPGSGKTSCYNWYGLTFNHAQTCWVGHQIDEALDEAAPWSGHRGGHGATRTH